RERHDHVNALAASEQGKARKLRGCKNIADIASCGADIGKGDVLGGIEIEDEPVGMFEIVDRRAPYMEFECRNLCSANEPRHILYVEIGRAITVIFGDHHFMKSLRHAGTQMLLEKTLLGDAIRT